MFPTLDGATRLHYIVGDPIAQVKSPAGMTQAFADRGRHAVCVPAHVVTADLAAWVRGVSLAHNVDGIIVTVPHKFDGAPLCDTLSERAAFLQAVNMMRRGPGGGWHGDMCDGLAMVAAIRRQGCEPQGQRALVIGAGGAGSAIAHALVEAGVRELAIHDPDQARRDALLQRLAGPGAPLLRPGSADPQGFDLVVNASPLGMQVQDPYPVDVARLAGACCACVVTAPAVPPWIAAARAQGCVTVTGIEMFAQVRELLVEFLVDGR